ncbi:MAG: DEAD/DEAH box helicase [Candidatus Hermodarchaeia archaeon]|jgi:replicative superfamily II helicase
MKPSPSKIQENLNPTDKQNGAKQKIHPDIREILIADGIRLLHPIQIKALDAGALDGKNLLVCSPSGSGKTLIGELVSVHQALAGRKALLLVPLRALASEKFLQFQSRYRKIGIQLGISTSDYSTDSSDLATKDIAILTYERFDWLLRMEPDWLDQVGVIVIDEIHNLAERIRGPRLESSISRLRQILPDVQIIGLSATIANPKELASWLGCHLIFSDERPVELRHRVILAPKPLHSLARLVRASVRKGGQVLIFTPSRREAERISLTLVNVVKPLLSSVELKELGKYYELATLEDEVAPIRERLASRSQFGVAFHHAGLDVASRRFVEDLYQKRLLKVICCTTTLGAGINTPARLVILLQPLFAPGKQNENYEVMHLSANRVHQILGRAGRPGQELVGFAVLLASTPEESEKIQELYFHSNDGKSSPLYNRVKSQLFSIDTLREQVLVLAAQSSGTSVKEVEAFFKKTFWWHQNQIDNPKSRLEQLISIGCLDVETLLSAQLTLDPNDEKGENTTQSFGENRIELTLLTSDRIEGRINDGGWFTCAFSDSGPVCSCRQHYNNQTLCSHLLALAKFTVSQYPQYAREIIPRSLKEEFILDYLERNALLVLREGRYFATALGRLAVKLYVRPSTALWFKSRFPVITTGPSFIESVIQGLQFESDFRKTPRLSRGLGILVEKTGSSLIEAARKGNVEIGDLETLLHTVIWLAKAIISIAQLTGYDEVTIIGEPIVEAWENYMS